MSSDNGVIIDVMTFKEIVHQIIHTAGFQEDAPSLKIK